jgi:Carbohydrate esterase, sialic acid-specific acetylesterase
MTSKVVANYFTNPATGLLQGIGSAIASLQSAVSTAQLSTQRNSEAIILLQEGITSSPNGVSGATLVMRMAALEARVASEEAKNVVQDTRLDALEKGGGGGGGTVVAAVVSDATAVAIFNITTTSVDVGWVNGANADSHTVNLYSQGATTSTFLQGKVVPITSSTTTFSGLTRTDGLAAVVVATLKATAAPIAGAVSTTAPVTNTTLAVTSPAAFTVGLIQSNIICNYLSTTSANSSTCYVNWAKGVIGVDNVVVKIANQATGTVLFTSPMLQNSAQNFLSNVDTGPAGTLVIASVVPYYKNIMGTAAYGTPFWTLPSAPVLTMSTVTTTSATITWPALPGVTTYDLLVNGIIVANTIAPSAATYTHTFASGAYGVAGSAVPVILTAKNASGSGPSSAPVSFTVPGTTTTLPLPPTVATSIGILNGKPLITWTAPAASYAVTTYTIRMALTSNPATLVVNDVTVGTTPTSYPVTQSYLAGTSYVASVWANNATGRSAAVSPITFTTAPGTPAISVSSATPVSTILTWPALPGVTAYDLLIDGVTTSIPSTAVSYTVPYPASGTSKVINFALTASNASGGPGPTNIYAVNTMPIATVAPITPSSLATSANSPTAISNAVFGWTPIPLSGGADKVMVKTWAGTNLAVGSIFQSVMTDAAAGTVGPLGTGASGAQVTPTYQAFWGGVGGPIVSGPAFLNLPAAPDPITVSSVTTSGVTFSWPASTTNGVGSYTLTVGGVTVTPPAANATSYTYAFPTMYTTTNPVQLVLTASNASGMGGVAGASFTPIIDSGFDIILAMGQSNCVGNCIQGIDPVLDATNARMLQYGYSTNPATSAQAVDPLLDAQHSPANSISPVTTFTKNYVTKIGAGRSAVIVMCAVNATGLCGYNWQPYSATDIVEGGFPNATYSGVGGLFRNAIQRAKEAAARYGATAKMGAMLWVQGEADAGGAASIYQTTLLAFIARMRTELSSIPGAATCPFVMGGMVPDYTGFSAAIAGVHAAIPSLMPYTAYSPGPVGYSAADQPIHYSAPGYRLLGAGMATKYDAAVLNTSPSYLLPTISAPTGAFAAGNVTITSSETVLYYRCRVAPTSTGIYGVPVYSTLTNNMPTSNVLATGVASLTGYTLQVSVMTRTGVSSWVTVAAPTTIGTLTTLPATNIMSVQANLNWTPPTVAGTVDNVMLRTYTTTTPPTLIGTWGPPLSPAVGTFACQTGAPGDLVDWTVTPYLAGVAGAAISGARFVNLPPMPVVTTNATSAQPAYGNVTFNWTPVPNLTSIKLVVNGSTIASGPVATLSSYIHTFTPAAAPGTLPYTMSFTNASGTGATYSSTFPVTNILTISKYAGFKASDIAALGPVTGTWTDYTGNGRNLSTQAGQPIKAMVGALHVVRTSNVNQGFADAAAARIMPITPTGSDYSKMILFTHNTASDVNQNQCNYFSTFTPGSTSLLWRSSNLPLIVSASASAAEVASNFTPVAGTWYAMFVTFVNATKAAALYINVAGTATLQKQGVLSAGMTVDGPTGVLMLPNYNSLGVVCDCIEVATWNIPLTTAQMTTEIQRMNLAYPGINL